MLSKPRKYMGSNCEEVRRLIPAEPESKESLKMQQKESATSKMIEELKNLMKLFQHEEIDELLRSTNDNEEYRKQLRNIFRSRDFNTIYSKAKQELQIERLDNNETYYDWFLKYNTAIEDKFLGEEDTLRMYLEWCDEQHIDPASFITSAHAVLSIKEDKKIAYICKESQTPTSRNGCVGLYQTRIK
ncbi:hypothetical protein ACF0H5_018259 [Mactra antiquata]